jgi:hypothetical protein
MTTIQTHCALRLGDNLAALHFLRGLARKYPEIHFRHAALLCYLQQLVDLTCDLPNLQLADTSFHNGHSWNLWKNADGFWETHPLKNDYAAFMLEFFTVAAKRMGLESPFATPDDLLFDYPALHGANLPIKVEPLDVLFINSPPMSGQWSYDPVELNGLVQSLAQVRSVITTHPTGIRGIACTATLPGFSVTNIGQLSQHCRNIVMVSTGPSWPTFNVWNRDSVEFRLIFIDHETIGLTKNTEQCRTIAEATRVLKVRGLL